MQGPVFAANWKMHYGPTDARAFMRSFLANNAERSDRELIFFPPAISLTTVIDTIRDRPDIRVGVQNIHWEDKGAYTGETSAPMAREAGATLALVGHSERRHVFGESDEETGKKVAAAVRAGLIPMLCVGEKLEDRERGETAQVVIRQLRAGLSQIDPHAIGNMVLAYEPVWAIGTGKTATPDDASTIHLVIRDELQSLLGERAKAVPICYGGSVNRGNAAALLLADEVGGLLVGGASMDADGWSSIVRT
ncbi:MAG: triose-phosphate isomerase [Gemmatimonadaceae bacterium]